MAKTFNVGDLVSYLKNPGEKQPTFMLWHRIQSNGLPALDLHPHRWRINDVAIILDRNGAFLKILKSGGGVGWVLAAWCKNEKTIV